MPKHGCTPDSLSYNPLLHGFCKEEKMDRAIEYLEIMVSGGCYPDILTYYTCSPRCAETGRLISRLRYLTCSLAAKALGRGAWQHPQWGTLLLFQIFLGSSPVSPIILPADGRAPEGNQYPPRLRTLSISIRYNPSAAFRKIKILVKSNRIYMFIVNNNCYVTYVS
ncbi:hypothetical protein U1Q18_015582 [Sarracenia purpurea var. burkii]